MITKPTRVTHSTATVIDNINVKACLKWDSLTALGTNEAYTRFISEIRNLLDTYAPLKKSKYLQNTNKRTLDV